MDKFKPKLTTDDCFTPEEVYETVAAWVEEKYLVDRGRFVRPFYPGGDFERYPYRPDDIVVDNPPFSIMTKIVAWYDNHEIPFFLFAPAMTGITKTIVERNVCILALGVDVTYANGAKVKTSFVTNMERKMTVRSEPELFERLEKCKPKGKDLEVWEYPDNVVTLAKVNYLSQHGTRWGVRRGETIHISKLDAQKQLGKEIFGGGLLVSDRDARKKRKAEETAKLKAEEKKEKAKVLELSAREREMVEELGRRQDEWL